MTAAQAERSATRPGPPRVVERVGRLVRLAAVFALGMLGLALPDAVLVGGITWLAFLVFACAGWGHLVARAARVDAPDLGLIAVWGIAGYLAIAGALVALGVCSRPVILALLGLGFAGFAWRELTANTASWTHVRDAIGLVRRHPALSILGLILVATAVVHVIGAIAKLDRNPWDDDLIYTPLVQRVLSTGDLIEPFSFRRMGAYGGQTLLQALAGARGSLASVHVIDQGLCYVLTLLLVVGHARERKTTPLWLALLTLVLLLLPDTSINTASYWSGAALLLALYRTATRGHWLLVGLVAAAACTLRQSYLPVVAMFVGGVLASRMFSDLRPSAWREAWRVNKPILVQLLVAGGGSLLGWWIAAVLSNRTFLFPLVPGTFNHELSLAPAALSWVQELEFFMWCSIETAPLVVLPPLFVVLVLARDPRPGSPLTYLFIATTLGFVLLIHSFTGSEPAHLWRYAFGPGIALLAVFIIELGSDEQDAARVALPELGRWVLLASMIIQVVASRASVPKHYASLFDDVREAIAIGRENDPQAQVERRRYAALQAAVPEGAPLAVMVDDPRFLNYGRNHIYNLDTPGYASPGSQLPSFRGPEAWRAYFLRQGIRYVAFVRSESSRYFFRRPFWVWRLFNDSQLFQAMAAYTIDAIDTFAALAATVTVLHDADGLVALDLGNQPISPSASDPRDEATRRGAWVRELAYREGLRGAWSLNSRENVLFEDGLSGLVTIDEEATDDPLWFEIMHKRTFEPKRGTPARWLFRRAHIRLRGAEDMRLTLRGKVNVGAVHTRPRLDVSLNGALLGSAAVDEHGAFALDAIVPRSRLDGWCDLYLVFNSVAEPESDMRDLRVARLLELGWEPIGGAAP